MDPRFLGSVQPFSSPVCSRLWLDTPFDFNFRSNFIVLRALEVWPGAVRFCSYYPCGPCHTVRNSHCSLSRALSFLTTCIAQLSDAPLSLWSRLGVQFIISLTRSDHIVEVSCLLTLNPESRHIIQARACLCWLKSNTQLFLIHCTSSYCISHHLWTLVYFFLQNPKHILFATPSQFSNLILILTQHQLWQLQLVHLQLHQMQMRQVFKCLGNTIDAHTFVSLSLGELMQARQPSLRRFVV